MPLSDKEIRDLAPTSKRQRVSCGDSLLVVVESVGRGGGKSFVGTTRFPPGRSGKQVDVRIGVYGRGAGKWTLQDAGRRHRGVPEHQDVAQEFTLTNYRRQLETQVRECITGSTPLRKLEWDNGGRENADALREYIEDRGSYDQAIRVQRVLAQALDDAILQGWMRRNQNPANKQKG